MPSISSKSWFVYILSCDDGTFYTGITKNLEQRLKKHQSGKGAKYTRARGAKQILYFREYSDRQTAAVREYEIKQLTHKQKQQLIEIE